MTMKRKFDYQENKAGREVLVDKWHTGDCVVRSITLATGKPYEVVWEELSEYTDFCPLTGATHSDSNEYLDTQGWRSFKFKGAMLTMRELETLFPDIWAGKCIIWLYNHTFFMEDYNVHDYGEYAAMCDFVLDVCYVHVPISAIHQTSMMEMAEKYIQSLDTN